MSPRRSQPLTVEYALLGLLRQQPMHGYELHHQLADPTGLGLVWHLKQSRLYALLDKLAERGYLTQSLEPQESRPPRKVFELTEQGEELFLEWVQSPVLRPRRLRLDFLAKLYFARREGAVIAAALLDRQQATCRTWLAEQQAQADALPEANTFDWLVHRFRINQIEAMLTWLNTCRRTLEQGV